MVRPVSIGGTWGSSRRVARWDLRILQNSTLAFGRETIWIAKDYTGSMGLPGNRSCEAPPLSSPMLSNALWKSSSNVPRLKPVSNSFGGLVARAALPVIDRSLGAAIVEC